MRAATASRELPWRPYTGIAYTDYTALAVGVVYDDRPAIGSTDALNRVFHYLLEQLMFQAFVCMQAHRSKCPLEQQRFKPLCACRSIAQGAPSTISEADVMRVRILCAEAELKARKARTAAAARQEQHAQQGGEEGVVVEEEEEEEGLNMMARLHHAVSVRCA